MTWRPKGDKPLPEQILTKLNQWWHICVGNLTITGSDNGLSPDQRHAIIWTNAGILLIEIHTFSFNKMHLKQSPAKWCPLCFGLNVLILYKLFWGYVCISIISPHLESPDNWIPSSPKTKACSFYTFDSTLLMPWLLESLRHQQPRYWACYPRRQTCLFSILRTMDADAQAPYVATTSEVTVLTILNRIVNSWTRRESYVRPQLQRVNYYMGDETLRSHWTR